MQGQDATTSPAPSRSGPYRGPDAAATALAAERAEADADLASEAEKSQDALPHGAYALFRALTSLSSS